MKIIGLTPLYDVAENRLFMLRKYIELIERNGAYAIILPFNSDRKFLEEIVDRLDGIVFTGGLDVAPSYYGEDKILECIFGWNFVSRFEKTKRHFHHSFPRQTIQRFGSRGYKLRNVQGKIRR